MKWQIARVDELDVVHEDHGFLSLTLGVSGKGWGQGVPLRVLGSFTYSKQWESTTFALDQISDYGRNPLAELHRTLVGIMTVLQIDRLHKGIGKTVFWLASSTEAYAIKNTITGQTFWFDTEYEAQYGHITDAEVPS